MQKDYQNSQNNVEKWVKIYQKSLKAIDNWVKIWETRSKSASGKLITNQKKMLKIWSISWKKIVKNHLKQGKK